MKLHIERGIPIPPPRKSTGHRPLMRKMVKGDSLWLPVSQHEAARHANEIFGQGHYRTRLEMKKGIDGVRVWRK